MAGEDEDYGSARITIDLDDTGVVADSRALGARIQDALVRATRDTGLQIRRNIQRGLSAAAVTIRVDPDLSRFDAALLGGLRTLDSIDIPVVPDLTGFVERLRAALAGEEISVRVVPDLDGFDARIRTHRPPDVPVNVDVDNDRLSRALTSLGGVALKVGGILGKGLKIGALGIAAAGAAQSVTRLLAALAPAAGIIAAFPAALAGFQIGLGTLKLALLGVSDALAAAFGGNAKQFQAALDGLAPSAQKAVSAVHALAPELTKVQQSIQQSFFAQFADQVKGAIKNLLPLGTNLEGLSKAFGQAASGALKFAASQQALTPLRTIIQGTTGAAAGLRTVLPSIAAGLLDVAASVSKAFGTQTGGAIAALGTRVGAFLQRIGTGGQAVAWVKGALTVFQQLGAVAANVGHIIGSVFSAAGNVGGGLLNNLIAVTGAFREFVSTAQGQAAVGAVFKTVASIAAQLGPILSALVTQLGHIAPALTPVFSVLGPALVALVNSLGPGIARLAPSLQTVAQALAQGLVAIGPALGPLGAELGLIVAALAPVLPLAGKLVNVLAVALAPALRAVALLIAPIVNALVGALLPILPPISTAFAELAAALVPLAAGVGQAVAQLFKGPAPLLSVLAGVLLRVVTALVPLVTAMTDALLPVLPQLIGAFNAVVAALLPILPPIAQLVEALSPLLVLIVQLVAVALRIGAAFDTWFVINAVVPVIQGVVTVLAGLVSGISSVITYVIGLPGRIAAALPALGAQVVSFFSSLVSQVASGLTTGFDAVVGFFTRLPGLIVSALAALPSLLVSSFVDAVAAVGIVLLTELAGLIVLFTVVPGKIASALGSLASTIAGAFRAGFNAAVSATTSFIGQVGAFFAALPGRVGAVLSALPGQISSAFRSAGSSALSTARSFGSSVVSFFSGLPGRVGSALSAVGSRIASVFRSAYGSARSAVSSLIGSIVSLFSTLPGRILNSLGNIGSRIVAKIKSGLPSAVKNVLPFAQGGIVTSPVVGLVGEAGPEVIIPLTKPQRARQLAKDSGLLDILAGAGRGGGTSSGAPAATGPGVVNFHIHEVGDARVTAHRVTTRLALAAGVI